MIVIDRYAEYADTYLANLTKTKKDILSDPDKDGYNNLTEWILESDGSDAGSVPPVIRPAAYDDYDPFGLFVRVNSYFGFNINVKLETVPRVDYILQRSKDQGKTWTTFKSDTDWRVGRVTTVERGVTTTQIRVRSRVQAEGDPDDLLLINPYVQPPGTLGDMYRVKVSLAK
ncbi:MAG: hypothetical protein EOP84_32355 [Verrucomicrobiaceae bacterium]|nr:MAG: hypothetical protein EOP84_32355 [Verrucomicrobiaceae bacterium]